MMPPWSYSSLNKFLTCPKQYELVRVKKSVVEAQGEAAAHGEIVHRHLELRVKENTPLPESLRQYEGIMAKILAAPGEKFTERKFAIDSAFTPCGWRDSWARGIIDVGVVNGKKAVLLDYKTGKRKPGSTQLMLSAALVMHTMHEIQEVSTGYVWLKDNDIERKTIRRDELPLVWQEFLPAVRRLEQAYETDVWQPKPSGLCVGWCPVPKEQCQFKQEKKR